MKTLVHCFVYKPYQFSNRFPTTVNCWYSAKYINILYWKPSIEYFHLQTLSPEVSALKKPVSSECRGSLRVARRILLMFYVPFPAVVRSGLTLADREETSKWLIFAWQWRIITETMSGVKEGGQSSPLSLSLSPLPTSVVRHYWRCALNCLLADHSMDPQVNWQLCSQNNNDRILFFDKLITYYRSGTKLAF